MLARIHILGNWDLVDEDVFAEIEIPYPLQVGDSIYLKTETLEQLKKMASANREIASRYFPDWFPDKSSKADSIEEADLDDIDFSDAMTIRYISYTEGNPYVDITLVSYEDQSDVEEIQQTLGEIIRALRQSAVVQSKSASVSGHTPPVNKIWWKFQNKSQQA